MNSPKPETQNRQVRVFISSTFRDMHAERDHLVTIVFPELRERVEQLGLEFFDVDLRWGVPAKDLNGETSNSWEYCRKWINEVRPFFVCILGERYGYQPKPQDLKAEGDRQMQEREILSITEMEVRHALIHEPEKRRSYFYLRKTIVPKLKSNASDEDRTLYGEFVDGEPAATKLTILKDKITKCGRPVRNYSPKWTGQGFVALKEFGDLVLDDLWSGVLRDERYVSNGVWRQVLNADPDTDRRYTDETQPVPRELWEKIVVIARPTPVSPLDAEREQMEAFAASRLRWFQGRDVEIKKLTEFILSTDEKAPRLAVVAAVPGQGKSALLAKLSTLIPQPSAFLINHFVGATEYSATAHALVERLLGELDRSGIEWPADEQKEGEEPKRGFNSLSERLRKRLGDYAGDRRIVILLDALNQLTDGHDINWLPARLGASVRVVASCVDDATKKADSPEQRVLHALASRQPSPLRVLLGLLTEDDVRTIVVEYLKEYCKELDREHVDAICRMDQAKNPLYLLVILGELRTLGGNDMNRIVGERIAALPHDFPDTVALFQWVLQRLEVFGVEEVRDWCVYLAHGRVGMASQELADLLARKFVAGLPTTPSSVPQVSNTAATALLIERGLRRYLLRRGGQLDFFHSQLRQAVFEQYAPQDEAATVHREMADYFTACAKGTDPKKEWETDNVRGFAECIFHRTKAGQYEQAVGLLTNFPFLLHKLRIGLLEGVFEDYDMVQLEAPAEVVRRLEIWADFFREKAHILRRGNEEWPAYKILLQLAVEHADDSPITLGAEHWLTRGRCDWLWLCRTQRIPHACKNPCLTVFEGHNDSVDGGLVLADGRLLSWSRDRTLRLWDIRSGVCSQVLRGHLSGIKGVLELPDSRLLSWGYPRMTSYNTDIGDCTLRLWDIRNGRCMAILEGHSGGIGGAVALFDGRLLSWSKDHSLRLWDCQNGTCLLTLDGHTDEVDGALELEEGILLSWSKDKTLRMWDTRNGNCLNSQSIHIGGVSVLTDRRLLLWSSNKILLCDNRGGFLRLDGHLDAVVGMRELVNGKLLSWSTDKTLRIWDVQNGNCEATLEGHLGEVRGTLVLSNERILSWASYPDCTIRLWDGRSGACLKVLHSNPDRLEGALELSDGRLLSWGAWPDCSLSLWDIQNDMVLATRWDHSDMVNGAVELLYGKIVSWSRDKTLRYWDSHSSASLSLRAGHASKVDGTLSLHGGQLLTWSIDKTLKIWDSQSGACLTTLQGHTDRISGAVALSDGRLISWSQNKELRLWDGQCGKCLLIIEAPEDGIKDTIELADGRLLSWWGCRLWLWDSHSGLPLLTLEGHEDSIGGVLELADGRLVSWSEDRTLRLWNSQSGSCLAILTDNMGPVYGALILNEERLLSWSIHTWIPMMHLWDINSGAHLEKVPEQEVSEVRPEWALAHIRTLNSSRIVGDFYIESSDSNAKLTPCGQTHSSRTYFDPEGQRIRLHYGVPPTTALNDPLGSWNRQCLWHCIPWSPGAVACWEANVDANARCLLPDGTAVVTQDNGQVCILKLYYGQRRITLAEAEELLTSQMKKAE